LSLHFAERFGRRRRKVAEHSFEQPPPRGAYEGRVSVAREAVEDARPVCLDGAASHIPAFDEKHCSSFAGRLQRPTLSRSVSRPLKSSGKRRWRASLSASASY